MNKTCARCEKTVYPTEELKCLDKVWHKGCFKCQACGMTLNMRTYKGFNKQPFCEAHIPKAKATTMAETPELKRIAENTKIQSNVKYHEDFERSKGKFTQVADDPETLRIKQNSKIISNVAYHGELAKKAAMEQKRTLNENGEYIDVPDDNTVNANHKQSHASSHPSSVQYAGPPAPAAPVVHTASHAVHTAHTTAHSTAHTPSIGKISDYDPLSEQPKNSPYSARQSQTLIYTSDQGAVSHPPTRKIGSIADIDPVNNVYGSLSNPEYHRNPNQNQYHQQQQHQQQQQHHQQQQQHHQSQHQHQQHQHQMQQNHAPPQQQMHHQSHNPISGRVYRAMYDYEAQDSDEVSFCDGDLIINVSNIDGGWMTGQVQRTGNSGMLPANYVELAHI